MTPSATVIHPDPATTAPGLRHRVSARLLGGTTSIHEGLLAPGELIPPHTHANEDHCLYVVSGTVHLQIADQLIEAPAGSYVIKPRGLLHAFWNLGSTPALALEITTPGGFETYYNDMANITSPAQALAVQAKYGITFHGDLAAQLISRHRLHVGAIPQVWQ
jgi:quercetin dioxygenase-like cupin family protein